MTDTSTYKIDEREVDCQYLDTPENDFNFVPVRSLGVSCDGVRFMPPAQDEVEFP